MRLAATFDAPSNELPEPGVLLNIAIVGGALVLARGKRRTRRSERVAGSDSAH